MGLFSTRWEATYEGKTLVVKRNEFTRGFDLECDGVVLASKAMSLIGLGELEGTLTIDGGGFREVAPGSGRAIAIKVSIESGSECSIAADGQRLEVRHVK
jgi:hypothetical protein